MKVAWLWRRVALLYAGGMSVRGFAYRQSRVGWEGTHATHTVNWNNCFGDLSLGGPRTPIQSNHAIDHQLNRASALITERHSGNHANSHTTTVAPGALVGA